ncbi:hypothetical protein BGK67_17310 [Streptomyces subrutilus]|uniref:Uncharacterized protein n=1 Tax=Streptomyces subrutilus TaxID=36818 RepID=A0A1E5PU01_9ACTN|nr:hypothetical protein BGK67_17310 [Streptomyces subrutilus]
MTGARYPISPTRAAFGWKSTPPHRIPDEATATRSSPRGHNHAVAKGLPPAWRELGMAIPRYFRRSYHPSQEGSLRRAVEYLAASPAARAAAGAVGRAAMS